MNGDAFKIHLKPDAQPYARAKARRIPIPYMDQLKKLLDEMKRLGVISSHKKPSTCCHPIVIAPKKDNDKLRICIDFTHLNKFTQDEFHPSNLPFKAVTSIPAEKLKYVCKFDACHGYWQVPLHPEPCALTCFITPFGRYVCNRAAFGNSSISERYNHCMDKVVHGLQDIRKIVDRCFMHGVTLKHGVTRNFCLPFILTGNFLLSNIIPKTSNNILKLKGLFLIRILAWQKILIKNSCLAQNSH